MLIRPIAIEDAEAAARLSGELGYPAEVEAMRRRIESTIARTDRTVLVACVDRAGGTARVTGWIDVGIVHHLQVEPYGEIGGLVVAAADRNRGIGQKLVAAAEEWIAQRGLAKVTVRSQIAREGAHRFYLREGYERVKTSAVFSKVLAPLELKPGQVQ